MTKNDKILDSEKIKKSLDKNSLTGCKLDEQSITGLLNYPLNIKVYNTITSTNTVLKDMAVKDASEGTVLIANEQTLGRGRMGRRFESPATSGVYFSILLRPDIPAEDSLFLTTSAAVAVAKAIEAVSDCKAEIKWVNDIYCNGGKVCGILTEAAFNSQTGKLDYAIVGIGINLYVPDTGFDESIKNIAEAVWDNADEASGEANILVAQVLNYFMEYYNSFESKSYLDEYISRSMVIGKDILVLKNGQSIPATALSIDNRCRLLVRYADGTEELLSSGEVSTKLL